jgi:hypothetical protein
MANDDEVFKNFLIEIAERLAEFDQGLRELEQAYNVKYKRSSLVNSPA